VRERRGEKKVSRIVRGNEVIVTQNCNGTQFEISISIFEKKKKDRERKKKKSVKTQNPPIRSDQIRSRSQIKINQQTDTGRVS
jgi:hypothetical protein